MVLGWIITCVFLVSLSNLYNQTREYTNIQILKKALFSMFPSYSIARLHGWNARNFQVMQVSCKLYNWKDNSYAESCIYKTLNILWVRLDKRLTTCYTTYVPLDWNKYLWINSEKNLKKLLTNTLSLVY